MGREAATRFAQAGVFVKLIGSGLGLGQSSLLVMPVSYSCFQRLTHLHHHACIPRPKLAGTTFQKDLGTLLDKSQRMESLVEPLAQAMGLAQQPGVVDTAKVGGQWMMHGTRP